MSERFKKAMVSNAQLDNEKQALSYQVDCLKDRYVILLSLRSWARTIQLCSVAWRQAISKIIATVSPRVNKNILGPNDPMLRNCDHRYVKRMVSSSLKYYLAWRRIELPLREEIFAILMLQIAGKCTFRYQNCSHRFFWRKMLWLEIQKENLVVKQIYNT